MDHGAARRGRPCGTRAAARAQRVRRRLVHGRPRLHPRPGMPTRCDDDRALVDLQRHRAALWRPLDGIRSPRRVHDRALARLRHRPRPPGVAAGGRRPIELPHPRADARLPRGDCPLRRTDREPVGRHVVVLARREPRARRLPRTRVHAGTRRAGRLDEADRAPVRRAHPRAARAAAGSRAQPRHRDRGRRGRRAGQPRSDEPGRLDLPGLGRRLRGRR